MNVFKDYQLIGRRLYKFGLKEKSHLMWKYGGTPAIDATVWENHKGDIEEITFKTDKGRTFKIDRQTFDQNKEEINFGFGRQFAVPKEFWFISGGDSKHASDVFIKN